MGPVRFSTYNMLDLFDGDPGGQGEHYRLVVEAITALRTDVLAVQEIKGPDRATAGLRLRRLATDTGLRCLVPRPGGSGSAPALGFGARGFHVGLLWRDGIEPVPGSLVTRNRDFWHALAWVLLDVGGQVVRHASYHATPFGKRTRAAQSEILVAVLARPGTRVPTLVGADWNGESADRVPAERAGDWLQYEPGDPYAAVGWSEDLVHQCDWDYDERGRRRHWVDRTAGEVLWAGGLHDAAAALRAPWQPTAGHYPSDPYGARGVRRRIDGVRVTAEVLPALRAHRVTDTETTQRASDHLPVTVEYDPSAITGRVARGEGRPRS